MSQTSDTQPWVTDEMIVASQRFLNRTFGGDLQFPIYIIRAPTVGDTTVMSVVSGADSLDYRERIVDWQGGGYLIRLQKNQMEPVFFNTTLLHEAAHCLHPLMPAPVTQKMTGLTMPVPDNSTCDPRWRLPAWRSYLFHKPDFWRLCFHFWKRASLAGWQCCHTQLGQTWVDLDAMRQVIEPETIALLDLPLWKIARRPVPRDFQKLFDIDLSQLYPE
ncbi:MAG: hypothetical protein FWC50_08320 [Planctomycetaceae bacterium]|nr:hypothetical protein [Planctomycetaceae bacterium]